MFVEINRTRTSDDMQSIIEKEMEQSTDMDHQGILDCDQELKAKVAKELLDRAAGMFQWVKLRIGLFFPKPPLESPEKVEQELRLLWEANLQDLNETYKRLYMDNQNERTNTRKTYRIILSAFEPLTIAEVAAAVSVKADGAVLPYVTTEYIRRRCHNFVVENDDGFLEFAYESARLFLERIENHGDYKFVDVDDFSGNREPPRDG